MEYRNIFLANPAKLSVQRNQLVIQQEQQFTVPLEDIYGAAVCVCPHLQRQGFRGDPQKRILAALPSNGSVRMLVITERQYSTIELLIGKPNSSDATQDYEQLMLF